MVDRRGFFASLFGGMAAGVGLKVAQVHQVPGLGVVRFRPSALSAKPRYLKLGDYSFTQLLELQAQLNAHRNIQLDAYQRELRYYTGKTWYPKAEDCDCLT